MMSVVPAGAVPAGRLLPFALAALFVLPLAQAAWDDDAGTGADAPGMPDEAPFVAPGDVAGAVEPSDDPVDWFRVAMPPASFLRVENVGTKEPGVVLSEPERLAGTQALPLPVGGAIAMRGEISEGWLAVLAESGPTTLPGEQPYLLRVQVLPTPADEDDAGSGSDAPDRVGREPRLGTGATSGRLDSATGDVRDVYRIDAPQGTLVRVRATAAAHLWLQLEDPTSFMDHDSDFGRDASVLVRTAGDAGLLLRVANHLDDTLDYGLEVMFLPPPDVRIDDARIDTVPVVVVNEPTPARVHQRIVVNLSNVGAGDAPRIVVHAEVTHTVGQTRHVGGVVTALRPGERGVVTLEWPTFGEVGDATVRIVASQEHDAVTANNEVVVRSHVLVGGIGFGANAAAHRSIVATPLAWGGLSAEAYPWLDVWADAYAVTGDDVTLWVSPYGASIVMLWSRSTNERLESIGGPNVPPVMVPGLP